ncbi:methylated-DNA--[protein]-cysteine S-methyltransferase [Peribacillus sp. SCS-26]|uniref:methylated-DNA--[protein]-cysteine S-methyltransferase n=1 Tax=Paraperibacillus marinus TaxID=3115295 RepID=UPI0039066A0D
MIELYTADYESPVGVIEIKGTDEGVFSILFTDKKEAEEILSTRAPGPVKECYVQLHEYFTGDRMDFTFPYLLNGTPFQQNVWKALTAIPYAKTGTYKNIAAAIGNEKAIRAVGTANGRNRLSIVIPCHRIIGTNGTLTGYAGGLWRKEWLLRHEEAVLAKQNQ